MRALCGAIITAGAVIGLGLTAIGFGTRYAQTVAINPTTNQMERVNLQEWGHLDKPLVFVLVFLTATAIIGLGISFVGLAYHHHRRMHEMMHGHHDLTDGRPRIAVPPSVLTSEPPR